MAEPAVGVCAPWATEEDLCAPCTGDNQELIEAAAVWLQPASNIVYNLSGRQFNGGCEQTVRPCAKRGGRRELEDAIPNGWHWNRSWGSCGCGDAGPCGCVGNRQIQLGAYPISDVVLVMIDGEPLDPSLWRVDDWKWLVRLDDPDGTNPGWPLWQDLSLNDDEVGTWSVTFTWGRTPPPEGVAAVAVLACELAMSCNPGLSDKCRLPKRVTSVTREGVTMIMAPSDFLDKDGKTGIWELDLFVRSVNPQRSQRNGQIWSPGLRRRNRRPAGDIGS